MAFRAALNPAYHGEIRRERCMYLLTIRDGLGTRHIGPYPSPKHASDDLDRVLKSCSDRARWQIHALETPSKQESVLHAVAS